MPLELKHMTPTILKREVRSAHEDAEPWETIAAVMAEDAGKPFTIRHARTVADRLGTYHNDDPNAPKGAGRVWLQRDIGFGTAEITYQPAGCPWEDRLSCTVWRQGYSDAPNPKECPTRERIEELNPARYGAREARNVRRAALLDDDTKLRELSRAMNKAGAALADISALFVHNEPCEVEQYRFARAWGWDNSKGVYL